MFYGFECQVKACIDDLFYGMFYELLIINIFLITLSGCFIIVNAICVCVALLDKSLLHNVSDGYKWSNDF